MIADAQRRSVSLARFGDWGVAAVPNKRRKEGHEKHKLLSRFCDCFPCLVAGSLPYAIVIAIVIAVAGDASDAV